MYCPRASCAPAAMACCPTASASCRSPWHAHCSPHRDAIRCLCRRCLIALRGTVHAAENPCASSNASPPQNSTSQPSIPHEHHRQHSPTACSLHVSAAVCASRSEQLHDYAQSHPAIPQSQNPLPSTQRRPPSTSKNPPTESLTASPDHIQYP